jgi:riboflavin biosynthesis pyrimidine reductase
VADAEPPARFAEFARKKERDALEARLPPYVTVSDARPADALAVGSEWTRRLFDGDFYLSPPPDAKRPACSLVFVQSADGNTGAPQPSTLGGGATDTHLIYEGLSRVAADAVMAGAGTVRGGNIVFSVWHPELVRLRASLDKPRHPVQIVVTRRGVDVEAGMLFNLPGIRVLLLTEQSGATQMERAVSSRPWIAAVVVDGAGGLHAAFERLRGMGIGRISCVGGHTLAADLIDAGLVQDVYLTTSPRPGGEPGTPIYPGRLRSEAVVRKSGTGEETGVVFEHYVVRLRADRVKSG